MALCWPRAVVYPTEGHAPGHAARRDSGGDNDARAVYRLQASHTLPQIDCVTTVKTVLLRNPRHLRRFNRITYRVKRISSASLAVGCVLSIAFSLVDNLSTARVLSVASVVLLFVPLLLGFMVMRVDILRLLVGTYEFWYITLNSAASSVLLWMYFQDAARGMLPMVTLVSYISAFLVDASCSDARATTFSLATGATTVAIFMGTVAFQVMPATRSLVLFEANGRVLQSEDVILNSLGIVLLLLSRNAFRKYTTAPRRGAMASTSVVRLIGYRTRIRFVEVATKPAPQLAPLRSAPNPATEVAKTTTDNARPAQSTPAIPTVKMSQLRFVAPATMFHARNVLWPSVFDALPTGCGNLPICLLSWASLVLAVAAWTVSDTPAITIAALVISSVYRILSLALSDRAMLWLLLQSFDVQFQLVQHALAHFAAAYIIHDARGISVLTSWSWFSWLVTIDALTPAAKRRLCVSRRFLLVVSVVLLLAQTYYCAAFIFMPFKDRTILTLRVTKKHGVVLKAIPFFFTRLLSMYWWTWRLLWRVYTQDASELVVIQGGVEYDDFELHRKLVKRASKRQQTRQALHVASQRAVAWVSSGGALSPG